MTLFLLAKPWAHPFQPGVPEATSNKDDPGSGSKGLLHGAAPPGDPATLPGGSSTSIGLPGAGRPAPHACPGEGCVWTLRESDGPAVSPLHCPLPAPSLLSVLTTRLPPPPRHGCTSINGGDRRQPWASRAGEVNGQDWALAGVRGRGCGSPLRPTPGPAENEAAPQALTGVRSTQRPNLLPPTLQMRGMGQASQSSGPHE